MHWTSRYKDSLAYPSPLYRDLHLLVTSGSQDRFKIAHLGTPGADIW